MTSVKKGKEERVVIDGQLYLKTHVKTGAPESNRFTASGSGSTTLMPIDEDGNPVSVKGWDDPDYVEAEISFLRENFECVRLLEEDGRAAYPGGALDDLREHLEDLHGDLEVLDRMLRDGDLGRLDARIEGRLARIERERGREEGSLRRGRKTLDEAYGDLKRRIAELAPTMERHSIEVPLTVTEAGAR